MGSGDMGIFFTRITVERGRFRVNIGRKAKLPTLPPGLFSALREFKVSNA